MGGEEWRTVRMAYGEKVGGGENIPQLREMRLSICR